MRAFKIDGATFDFEANVSDISPNHIEIAIGSKEDGGYEQQSIFLDAEEAAALNAWLAAAILKLKV